MSQRDFYFEIDSIPSIQLARLTSRCISRLLIINYFSIWKQILFIIELALRNDAPSKLTEWIKPTNICRQDVDNMTKNKYISKFKKKKNKAHIGVCERRVIEVSEWRQKWNKSRRAPCRKEDVLPQFRICGSRVAVCATRVHTLHVSRKKTESLPWHMRRYRTAGMPNRNIVPLPCIYRARSAALAKNAKSRCISILLRVHSLYPWCCTRTYARVRTQPTHGTRISAVAAAAAATDKNSPQPLFA